MTDGRLATPEHCSGSKGARASAGGRRRWTVGGILTAGMAALLLAGCAAGPVAVTSAGEVQRQTYPPAAFAEACERWDDWDKPAPPFHLHGGTYHVGTCGISAVLITDPAGHLLIDSGTERGAAHVAANIQRLGFSLQDVLYLTHTQEHFDHVGGMALLKRRTGARLLASERASSVFESGIVDTADPQHGLHDPMAEVSVDHRVVDGEAIRLGKKRIVATYTPGHSPGAISWRWEECEKGRCLDFVFTDGLGPVAADDYRWSEHPAYLSKFRHSLEWLARVEADVCLAAHPSAMRLIERIESDSIVDPQECNRLAVMTRSRLDAIVDAERGR